MDLFNATVEALFDDYTHHDLSDVGGVASTVLAATECDGNDDFSFGFDCHTKEETEGVRQYVRFSF